MNNIKCDKILIESDGKNETILTDIVNEIAKIKNESNMVDIIYDNTKRVLENGQIK